MVGADCARVGYTGRERDLVTSRLKTDDCFIHIIPTVLVGKRRCAWGIRGALERYSSPFVGVFERYSTSFRGGIWTSLYFICIIGSTFY